MFDVGDNNDGSWYKANRSKFGRFRKEMGDSIFYDMDKMKNSTNTPIFADSFKEASNPSAEEMYYKFSARSTGTGFAGAVHMDSVVMTFADGRAEAVNANELKSKFDIQAYVDDNFKKIELTD
jgi:hypothetical protein